MGWFYIRVPSTDRRQGRWQFISASAQGPGPEAPGWLKMRQWDGSWVQHLDRNDPNAGLVRVRTHKGWEPALYMGPVPAPVGPLQEWDWQDFQNPHVMLWRQDGEVEGEPGQVENVTGIKMMVGAFGTPGYPAAFAAHSDKVSWHMNGYHSYSSFGVGHTTIDLELIKRHLPAKHRIARAEIEIHVNLSAVCDDTGDGGESERLTFPYENYHAYLYDTTAQGNPVIERPFKGSRYRQWSNWWGSGNAQLAEVKISNDNLIGLADAGFIVSGRHLRTFNFGTDTEWNDGGYGVGWNKTGSGSITRVVEYDEFMDASHIDFGLFVEELPMGLANPNGNGWDRNYNAENRISASAWLSVTVYEYEYQPPPVAKPAKLPAPPTEELPS